MYQLNLDNLDDLKLINQTQYAEAFGFTVDYINKVFNGKLAVKLLTAKGMISLAYNISVRNNDQMKELLAKHFTLVK